MLKKVFKDKRTILAISFLALFSLVVLASAINDVTFRPARRLSSEESEIARIPVGGMLESIADIPLEKQIAFLVMLFLFGVLVVAVLPPEMRKKLLKQFFRFILGGILIYYLIKNKPELFEGLFPIFNFGAGQGDPSQANAVSPPAFAPPRVSNWVSFFVTFIIILLIVLLVWRINRWWLLYKNAVQSSHPPLSAIAKVARASLRNLSSGGSVQDKIIQCYADMSRVVDARRGLYREYAMTPAEFAVRLESAGLPSEPVGRLTRLFEAVRYGARTSTQSDVDEAIACLKSILIYCGEAVS